MIGDYQVVGKNPAAPFTLKIHRGEGMCVIAMNWKHGRPPLDFVGFAIEYREPGGDRLYPLTNRINFPDANDHFVPGKKPSTQSPFQKFQ